MKIIKNSIIVLTTILLTAIVVMVSCKKTDPIETTGHITGIVTEDGSNEPVFAANVTLSGISSNYKTGGDGKFEIKDLDEGDYTITVEKTGYQVNKKQITVKAGKTSSADFSLKRMTAELSVDPSVVDFGSNESEKAVLIKNTTEVGSLTYKAVANESWINISNGEGVLSQSAAGSIKIIVNRTGLSVGRYNGTVLIQSNKNSVVVNVSMEVIAKQRASVNNLQANEVKHNTISVNASINSIGSGAVTAYGFCWGTSPNPTTADNKNNLGGTSTAKSFDATITGLTPTTQYYIRAYATNAEGTSYSDAVVVTTLSLPTLAVVRTFATIDIKYNQATGKGSVDNLGDGYVTSYGFCVSKSNSSPTLSDQVVNLGSTTTLGDFEGNIPNLQAETKYFVRAFATNSLGTAYGSTTEFTTKVAPPLVMSGLLAYYAFDQNNCNDYFGEADHNGVLQGNGNDPTFITDTPSGSGKSMKTTGEKYYYLLKNPDNRATNYTYSVWVKTKQSGTIYSSGGDYYDKIALSTNGRVIYNYYRTFSMDLTNVLFDGKWHHVVITKESDQLRLYVDNRLYSSETRGRDIKSGGYIAQGYVGQMDNLRIYNRALTSREISEIFNARQ